MSRGKLLAVGAVLVLGATACTSSDGSNTSANSQPARPRSSSPSPTASAGRGKAAGVLAAAYSTTVQHKTAKVSLDDQLTATESGAHTNVSATGKGVINFANNSADVRLSARGVTFEVRTLEHVAYVRVPAELRSHLPGHRPWLEVDVDAVAKSQLGASLSQLGSSESGNPARVLAQLQGVSDQVTKVGTATIHGTATTHYRAKVDLDKAAATEGGMAKQAMQRLEKQLGASTVPVDVWVDSDGVVHRLRESVTEHVQRQGSSGPTKVHLVATVTFYDFGTKTSISAPPASKTTDITKGLTQHKS